MKLSISLPANDVEFIDHYAQDQQIESRSAVLHKAIRLLRATELGAAYEDAWDQWSSAGDAQAWDTTAGDGVDPS